MLYYSWLFKTFISGPQWNFAYIIPSLKVIVLTNKVQLIFRKKYILVSQKIISLLSILW